MSDSVQPRKWQPTRLPHPSESPDKNTGVGCHFLLQCIKVKSESEVFHSCQFFATPWTAARQATLSIANSHSPHKPMSIELVIPSNHLIFCCPLLLLPALRSFQMSRLFTLGGQSIGVSASTLVLTMNTQDWSPLEWTGCSHCQIIITIILNKCAIPGRVSFPCERRAHFVYHHTTNTVIWMWPRVQRSKFKDHVHVL